MENLNQFIGLYPLSKTLRFELKPEPETLNLFEKWLADEVRDENLLYKDKKIAEAYVVLKPIMDKLHECFINISLLSETAKKINFAPYLEAYRNADVSNELEKDIRLLIGETFGVGELYFKDKFEKLGLKYKKQCLQNSSILLYIQNTLYEYAPSNYNQSEKEKFTTELKKHIESFKSFYTYFSGYNENRKNYYHIEEEKSTAIATRIVHDNLPKFCSNIIRFENRRDEYQSIYNWLNDKERITEIKNSFKGEFEKALPIEEKFFVISYFNQCLAQSEIEEYNRIIGNFNLLINLYNQNKKREDKSFRKLEEFTTLFKQIGCGKSMIAYQPIIKDFEHELTDSEKIQSKQGSILTVEALLNRVIYAGQKYLSPFGESNITVYSFNEFLRNCNDWRGIYWSKSAVNNISKSYFSNWHAIKDKLKNRRSCATYDKKREEQVQLRDAVELSDLFEVLDTEESTYLFKEWLKEENKIDLQKRPSENLISLLCADIEAYTHAFIDKAESIFDIWNKNAGRKEENDEVAVSIKGWLDNVSDAMHIIRYFSVRASKMKGNLANPEMENILNHLLNSDDADWFGWYDLIRNYLTQKPQDKTKENKLKLNFGKGNLLNGFTDSATDSDNGTQYGGYLFRRKHQACNEYEYFLGISKNSKLFRCHLKEKVAENDKSEFERLEYYQMKSTTPYPNEYSKNKKDIQKIVQELTIPSSDEEETESASINKAKSDGEILPTELFKRLNKSKHFKHVLADESLVKKINDTIALILNNCTRFTRIEAIADLCKQSYSGPEGLSKLLNDLKEITKNTKIFEFFNVSNREMKEHHGQDLFLFKISSKDLSYCDTHAKGLRQERTIQKENLHTLFFRALMHEEGFDDCVDLGKGEIFFREKAYEYSAEKWAQGHHAEELNGKFKYPIISNRRFAEDKYFLHLSIMLNYKADDKPADEKISNAIKEIENINFIGIDRGEKHLVYSCIIDKDMNILSCQHYDEINGTNYVKKLDEMAELKMNQRKNWKQQDGIRNLKDGYISHVVHRLTESAIKDNLGNIYPHAYIVLEDLNTEMKRGRQKVEKQVYQKLEVALAKKLNFVVDKNAKGSDIASVSRALQLTPKINNYGDIEGRKQFGVMLYTRANYTSVTDPATGWRQTIYIKDGNDVDIKKQIMSSFSDFGFDGTDYYFEYIEANVGKVWRIYPSKNGEPLDRFQNKKEKKEDFNVWVPEKVNTILLLDRLFENFDKTKSFKVQIEEGVGLTKIDDKKTSWQSLRYVIGIIQQIRNCGNTPADDNFLCSPVRNEYGIHFDTRNAENNGALSKIVDADANGAYNIARKGLIMDAHIKCNSDVSDLDLFISDKEWDMWLLDRNKWNENLQYFSSKSMKNAATSTKKKVGKKARK